MGLLVAALAGVVVPSAVALGSKAASPHPMHSFTAPQYWVTYDDGFVRRGLPGAVLASVGDPSYTSVNALAVGLSLAAMLAIALLAARLASLADDRVARVTIAAVVLASPLTLSLVARDVGRYDAIGIVMLVAVLVVTTGRLPPLVSVSIVAAVFAVAVATEELLFGAVGPVAFAVVWRIRRVWVVALLPGALLAVASAVVPPSPGAVAAVTAAARAAGVPPPNRPLNDAASRLGLTFTENLRSSYASTDMLAVVGTTAMWGCLFVLTVALVWTALGRSVRERAFVMVVCSYTAVAAALTISGIDLRRWWALVTLGALTLVGVLGAPGGLLPVRAPRRPVFAAALVLVVAGAWLQNATVVPVRPMTVWHPPGGGAAMADAATGSWVTPLPLLRGQQRDRWQLGAMRATVTATTP